VLGIVLLGCARTPGLTPMEQDSLVVLEAALDKEVVVTLDRELPELDMLAVLWREFVATPLELHVVWQTEQPPTTEMLAKVPGKKVRQYWDRGRKTVSTGGHVRVKGVLTPIEWLPLRVALARAAARPAE
jgi:hypothetical protein